MHLDGIQSRKRKHRKHGHNVEIYSSDDDELALCVDLKRYEKAIVELRQPEAGVEGGVERITDIFQELL